MIHARDDYNRIQDPAGKIGTDEPVFLLRAQDEFAAETVRYWARLVELRFKIAEMARKHADKMAAWPVHKTPDLPPPNLSPEHRDRDSSAE